MICIILTSPDGSQTIGLSTDGNANIGGVVCLPSFLASVSELSHRANISRATGCVPEAIEWGFDLIDWDGLVRRSAAILDGSSQLVGWTADLYVDLNLVVGAGAFEIVGAVASGTTVAISCRERWIGNTQTVGSGTGTNRVGLVVGGAPVTIKVPEIMDPVAIEYAANSGWYKGNGIGGVGGYSAAPAQRTNPSSIDVAGRALVFDCASASAALDLVASLNAAVMPMASGSLCVEQISSWSSSGTAVRVTVSQEFADIEDARNTFLCDLGNNSVPIAYGAASLIGFVGSNGEQLSMIGVPANSSYLQTFSPSQLAPGGFRAYSLIPCEIAFQALSPGLVSEPDAYYGSTESIITDLSALPDYGTYDADLKPSESSTWTMYGRCDDIDPVTAVMRVIPAAPADGFERIMVDVSDRVVVNQAFSMSGSVTARAEARLAYHSGSGIDWTSDPLLNSSNPALRNSWTAERSLLGPETYVSRRSFANVDGINVTFGFAAFSQSDLQICVNWQLRAVNLYGISVIQYGSSYAVVQPGASPWWTSPRNPAQTAGDLLDAIGPTFAERSPSYAVPAANWGRSFDQSTTFIEAAKELANEFWFFLGRGVNNVVAGTEGELPGPPPFTLGDRNDVVTEIVIEYDEWAGEYRRKAYVAHVDEGYDPGNQSRYFGGWDDEGAGTGYGLAIWNACRKAYKIHGIKSSGTIKSPGIRSAGVLGQLWTSTQNSVSRIQWLALQTRFVTLRIAESNPTWWAGNSVKIPLVSLDWAGYDLSSLEDQYLVCTEKTWDPVTLTTTFEVALPPVTSIGTQTHIIQALGATNRIAQRLDATKRYIQVQG